MKKLALELKKNGFNYKQMYREDYKAIYCQRDGDKIVGFEVFLIKSHDGFMIKGNFIEPSEMYPSNEAFGVSAWSIKSHNMALEKYTNLQQSTIELDA